LFLRQFFEGRADARTTRAGGVEKARSTRAFSFSGGCLDRRYVQRLLRHAGSTVEHGVEGGFLEFLRLGGVDRVTSLVKRGAERMVFVIGESDGPLQRDRSPPLVRNLPNDGHGAPLSGRPKFVANNVSLNVTEPLGRAISELDPQPHVPHRPRLVVSEARATQTD
jgi:hypothetical protein